MKVFLTELSVPHALPDSAATTAATRPAAWNAPLLRTRAYPLRNARVAYKPGHRPAIRCPETGAFPQISQELAMFLFPTLDLPIFARRSRLSDSGLLGSLRL